jgi:hypothetical protein
VISALTVRGLLLALACLSAACSTFQPVPTPPPDLLGTYVGTWGGVPTTLVIKNYGEAAPDSGLFLGSLSVGGPSQMQISGIVIHPSPQGPLQSTFSARVGYMDGQLILALSLPTMDPLENFAELSLAVQGDTLVGKAERDYPQGPKGPIKLVRQPPTPR